MTLTAGIHRFFRRAWLRFVGQRTSVTAPPVATVFDLTDGNRGIGHDLTRRPIDPEGLTLRAWGWLTPLPKDGDFAILSGDEAGTTTRYRFAKVRPCGDPFDMWHAELVFDPREANS